MALICLDTETHPIDVGLRAPPIVCVSFASEGAKPIIKHVKEAEQLVTEVITNHHIVAHNLSFDVGCIAQQWPHLIPKLFKAYDDCRMYCTEVRARLLDIAMGCHELFYQDGGKNHKITYQLGGLTKRFLGTTIEGKGADGVQKRYREVEHLPVNQWPEEFRKYAIDDVEQDLALFNVQQNWPELLIDQHRQVRGALGLNLTSSWGLNTNKGRVYELRDMVQAEYDGQVGVLFDHGLIRWEGPKKDPRRKMVRCVAVARDRYVNVCAANGIKPKLTKGKLPSLKGEFIKETGDWLLQTYADVSALTTQISTQIPALLLGTDAPLHTRYISLRETGRTSSQAPNVQNQSRRGGFRECFEPRYGNHYYQADYSSFELFCLAQVCINLLGYSRLGEMLNAGLDPHCEIASHIMGVSYEEAYRLYKAGDEWADDCRQTGKIANFGLPGGLQPPALVSFAKSTYNVTITLQQAIQLKQIWEAAFPEMQAYFAIVKQMVGRGTGTITQLYSQRVRGKCRFTQASNSFFQGLAADAAKAAYWLIIKACYVDTTSPLYDTRIVNFIHDEWIGEAAIARAPEAAEELSRLMVVGAQPFLPDMRIKAEPCVMKFWSKKAKDLRDHNGRLIAWPLAA